GEERVLRRRHRERHHRDAQARRPQLRQARILALLHRHARARRERGERDGAPRRDRFHGNLPSAVSDRPYGECARTVTASGPPAAGTSIAPTNPSPARTIGTPRAAATSNSTRASGCATARTTMRCWPATGDASLLTRTEPS